MKKILKIVAITFVVILSIIVVTPLLFKGKIKEAVEKLAEENLNADLYFDDFGLSLLSNFPNLTASLDDFGVIGKGTFLGDTLIAAESLEIEINLSSVFSGNYKVNGIYLNTPKIRALVNEDGLANWDDLMKQGTEEETVDTSSSSLNLKLPQIIIVDGNIIYEDKTLPMFVSLDELDYQGNITINGDLYEIINELKIQNVLLDYDDSRYVNNKRLGVDMILGIDLEKAHYQFKENTVKLNDLALVFGGSLDMPEEENMKMDIQFHTKETSFKNILSLVPSEYMKEYEELDVSGDMALNGKVSGEYADDLFPNFELGLNVKEGQIKYPDLPLPIDNINIDISTKNEGASLEKVMIEMKELSMKLADNPIFLKTSSALNLSKDSELISLYTDTYFKTSLDLKKITEVYPLEGTELKGLLNTEFSAKGTYNDEGDIPNINSVIKIKDLIASLSGDKKEYKITNALVNIKPDHINVDAFDALLGNSDISITGKVFNYINYSLGKEESVLKGDFDLVSNKFDVNEWVEETGEVEVQTEEEVPMEVVIIPDDLDFKFNSVIKELDYGNMKLDDFKGDLIVKNGTLNMKQLKFGVFNGLFSAEGVYDPRDTLHPKYSMDFGIDNMKIQDAYSAFSTVKALVPAAGKMNGNFSSNVKLSGELDQEMNPNYGTLDGNGFVDIANGTIKDLNIMKAISKVTKMDKFNQELKIDNERLPFQIENGTLNFQPFDLKVGDQKIQMGGSQGIDGAIDYKITTDAPANLASGLISNLGANTGDVKLNIGLGGTYDKPKPKILGATTNGNKSIQSEVKEQVSSKVKEKIDNEKKEVKEKAKKEIEKKGKDLLKKFF